MFPDFNSFLKPHFELYDRFPAGFKGLLLPGSNVRSATNNSGNIVMQEIASGELNIQLSNFYFSKKIKISFQPENTFLHSAVALKNTLYLRGSGIKNVLLKEGQYVFLHMGGKFCEAIFEKETEYQVFHFGYNEKTIREIAPLFPDLFNTYFTRVKQGKAFVFAGPARLPFPVKKITHEILHAPYEGEPLEYIFDKKIKESLCMLLLNQDAKLNRFITPTSEETEKLSAVADLLINRFDMHYPVASLAQQTHMNENKLQLLFRKLFGKTIYHYQRDAKLEKARLLILDEHTSVKYAALTVGYKSITAFETEFKKYFGFTPGSLLKKK